MDDDDVYDLLHMYNLRPQNATQNINNSTFSVFFASYPQLESHSSVGTAPTAPPRRATWRPMSYVFTASPSTTASTPTAAWDARTCPRGPQDCLRVSREIITHQGETRLAWHHSVGLDVVMATADTDSYYCFSFTSEGVSMIQDC